MNYVATVLFAVGILHTFLAGRFKAFGNRYREGSVQENIFHLLGETEVVFGLWSGVLFLIMAATGGMHKAVEYTEGQSYTEPLFVFVIMTIAGSRPVLVAAHKLIEITARLIPVKPAVGFYLTLLFVGPLLGSFITEPGAMTIIALLLAERYYSNKLSRKFMYSTIAVLFVNVSVGGCLTHFAAPPVLMVAGKWGWGFTYMLTQFGWRAVIACVINAIGITVFNYRELIQCPAEKKEVTGDLLPVPWALVIIHLLFMAAVVAAAHYPAVFMGIFLFFLGVVVVTKEFQTELNLKGAMLVGFFLGGLVFLGGLQNWWLQPLISSRPGGQLYFGATALTAVTDNAMLTYLASLVQGLSDKAKYAVVAGALSGGGVTLIANAPNPAGYSILKDYFETVDGKKEFSPGALFVAAIPFTLVVIFAFWALP